MHLSSRGLVILAHTLLFYTSQHAKICIWSIQALKPSNNVTYQLQFYQSSCFLVSLDNLLLWVLCLARQVGTSNFAIHHVFWLFPSVCGSLPPSSSLDNLQNSSKQTKRVAILVHMLPLRIYTNYTTIHMHIRKYIQMCIQIVKSKRTSTKTYTYLHIHTQPHTCIHTNTRKYTNSYMNTHQYIQTSPQELPQIYKHLSI